MNQPELSAIFCDDIRREQNGKDIYVGVYGDEVIVPQLPYALPNLYIAWAVRLPKEFRPNNILLEVHKDRDRIIKLDGKISIVTGNPPPEFGDYYVPTLRGIIAIPPSNLNFEQASTLRLTGRINDHTFATGSVILIKANDTE